MTCSTYMKREPFQCVAILSSTLGAQANGEWPWEAEKKCAEKFREQSLMLLSLSEKMIEGAKPDEVKDDQSKTRRM